MGKDEYKEKKKTVQCTMKGNGDEKGNHQKKGNNNET